MLDTLRFDNAFLRELPGDPESGSGRRQVAGAAWSRVQPTPVAAPRLLAHSREMASRLGLLEADIQSAGFAQVFGGNALVAGMDPHAANYGGHQFGHWAGQLGDGRAISLGEAIDAAGGRWELQLKGAGATPYSRSADGRAVLRSSLREFLCSEAMHHLGVPTTRALSLVTTGEAVVRDMFYDGRPAPEPGAIVCRVAPSFLRFGSFELPASRGEHALLRQLADFCIWRDFPDLLDADGATLAALRGRGVFTEAVYGAWFAQVCERTAVMVAHWMRVGFVHGVMNTDNMSILGLTIDYGPYGWIDAFDPDWTPNTTDAQGRRYRFGWQPRIAHWNLVRLAQALSPLFAGTDALQAGLQRYEDAFAAAEAEAHAAKLGLSRLEPGDEALVADLQSVMHEAEIDMTLLYRGLSVPTAGAARGLEAFEAAAYDQARLAAATPVISAWLARYRARLERDPLAPAARSARMRGANPRYVPRNYLAQQAIDRAGLGDASGLAELLEVLRRPYDEQPGREAYAARRPDWARDRAGCSMLSCSS